MIAAYDQSKWREQWEKQKSEPHMKTKGQHMVSRCKAPKNTVLFCFVGPVRLEDAIFVYRSREKWRLPNHNKNVPVIANLIAAYVIAKLAMSMLPFYRVSTFVLDSSGGGNG